MYLSVTLASYLPGECFFWTHLTNLGLVCENYHFLENSQGDGVGGGGGGGGWEG